MITYWVVFWQASQKLSKHLRCLFLVACFDIPKLWLMNSKDILPDCLEWDYSYRCQYSRCRTDTNNGNSHLLSTCRCIQHNRQGEQRSDDHNSQSVTDHEASKMPLSLPCCTCDYANEKVVRVLLAAKGIEAALPVYLSLPAPANCSVHLLLNLTSQRIVWSPSNLAELIDPKHPLYKSISAIFEIPPPFIQSFLGSPSKQNHPTCLDRPYPGCLAKFQKKWEPFCRWRM